MSNFKKNIRLISLIEGDINLLTAQANAIFTHIAEEECIEGSTIGQTYRTYESKMSGKQKSFYNQVFFTNSITLVFKDDCPTEKINETMAELATVLKETTQND